MVEKSELEELLKKNAYGEGLSEKEETRAWELIYNPEYADEDCLVCLGQKKNKAIYDTGLCQSHALYALITGK